MTKKSLRNKSSTLYRFKSLKDLKYNILEHYGDLIELVISRTNLNLIRYNNEKVFFMHPHLTRYGCDIFGDIYDLASLNQERIYQFQNIITIYITLNNEDEFPIQYKYDKFISESLNLYKSDIIQHNFENEYQEALHDEEAEAATQLQIKDDIKKYNQHIHDILNYVKNDTDDNSSDNDSDNDSVNDSDNDSDNDSNNNSDNDSNDNDDK